MNSSETLLVPVHLDCLVVNEPVRSEGPPWYRPVNDYSMLQQFDSPTPKVTERGSEPKIGVYLHWALPDALTRGRQKEFGVGPAEFPYVPNRWLVLRQSLDGARPWKAWMIESDYLDNDLAPHDCSPFVDPDPKRNIDGEPPTLMRLGRTYLLQPSTEEEAGGGNIWGGESKTAQEPFLRAVGPGDPTFAAWQPGVESVFSMHDNLRDLGVDDTAEHHMTYSVFGWYADAKTDPLHGLDREAFDRLMKDNKWSIEGDPATPKPSAILCHGTRFGVSWHSRVVPKRPNINEDDWKNLHVGVGHTAIDGLAAILEARSQEGVAAAKKTLAAAPLVAELFEAAQYGALPTLDEPGGKVRLDHQIRDHWFGSHPGGIRWEIVAADRVDDDDAPPPPLTEAQQEWLAKLNRDQRQLDTALNKLESLQWRLYAQWWKVKRWSRKPNKNHEPKPELKSLQDWAFQAVTDQQTLIKDLAANVPGLRAAQALQRKQVAEDQQKSDAVANAIASWLANQQHSLGPDLVLKPNAGPRFFSPTDPVVVVSGLKRARKHGEDGLHREDGTLLCRLSNQVVTALSGHTTSGLPVTIPSGKDIPDLTAIATEAFVLDPANASRLNVAEDAVAVLTAKSPPSATQPPLPTLNNGAILPSPVGSAAWEQAWVPMFLNWTVAYYPTVVPPKDDVYAFRFDRDRWQFSSLDGDVAVTGGPDYRYRDDLHGPLPKPLFVSGRTFLTPQAEYRFVEQIKRYVHDHPPEGIDEKVVEDFLSNLGNLDVLSQTLSGLNERLIMRRPHSNIPPGSDIADAIGDQYHATPDIEAGEVDPNSEKPYFTPIRGGFFHFTKLMVVDAFGQSVDLLFGNNDGKNQGDAQFNLNQQGSWPTFFPCRGRGLTPPETGPRFGHDVNPVPDPKSLMMLAPRIVQPARLDFNLLDGRAEPATGNTDVDEYDLVAGAQPVCGWVIPNHLDNALTVYDADGYLLGELILRTVIADDKTDTATPGKTADESTVDWLPAPAAEHPVNHPDEIQNSYLRGFVTALLPHPGSRIDPADVGPAFEKMLEVIDSTLWTVDPLGGRSDQSLSVLIGRPLALVRAVLRLRLRGDPVRDQYWGWDYGVTSPDKPGIDEQTRNERLRAVTAGTIDKKEAPVFEVRLGDPDLRNDGLMGYYLDEDFERFHSVHPLAGDHDRPAGDKDKPKEGVHSCILPIKDGAYIPLSLRENSRQVVTMLMDPRGAVHAATGLLPTKTLELPGNYVDDLLFGLRVTFRAGPLLTDAETLRFPRPAERSGTWGWLERTAGRDRVQCAALTDLERQCGNPAAEASYCCDSHQNYFSDSNHSGRTIHDFLSIELPDLPDDWRIRVEVDGEPGVIELTSEPGEHELLFEALPQGSYSVVAYVEGQGLSTDPQMVQIDHWLEWNASVQLHTSDFKVQRQQVDPSEWVEEPIIDLGHEARLVDDLPVLREGWLQLSEAVPKLSYIVSTHPSPLTVGTKGAITITIANGGKTTVQCSSIDFVVPLGTGAAALCEYSDGMTASTRKGGWEVVVTGHRVVVAPPEEGVPPSKEGNTPHPAMEFTLSGLHVNRKPGTARIFVVEATRGRPSASLAVTKVSATDKS